MMPTTRAVFPNVGPYKEKGSKRVTINSGEAMTTTPPPPPPPHPRELQTGRAERDDHSALDFGLASHVPLLILAVLGSMKQAKQNT